MRGRRQHPHLLGSLIRAAVIVAVAVAVPAVIVESDLLVLPAVALVLLAWLTIALVALAHWVLIVGAPPLVSTTKTAGAAGWSAIADDPVGRRLHHLADRIARLTRPARPAARWLISRLSLQPTGLPLTLATAVTVTALGGLARLGRQVDRPRSTVSLFDLRVSEVASRLEIAGERRVMEAITNIGATRFVLLVVALLVVGALAAQARHSALLLVATLAISSGMVTILKASHARPRPALGQLVERSTSFPSGHAAASLSLALGFVLWWWAADLPRPSLAAGIVVPVGLLIGYSRAYLSIHWLSDVLAGWLVAALAAAVTFGIDRLVAHRRSSSSAARPRPLLVATGIVTIVVAVIAVTGNHAFPTSLRPVEPTRLASSEPAALLASLPRFSETLLGRRMEPLGLVIVARDDQLHSSIGQSGYSVADRLTPGRLLHTYWAGITNSRDPTAPVTPTFLDTRLEDLAIQQQSLGRGVKARHHARLWRLPVLTPGGCPIWGVTASLDDRAEWTLRTLFPNHHIAPAIDTERDYLAAALAGTKQLNDAGRFEFVGPTLGTNAAGDPFFTDGKIALLQQAACG
jgi:undecaprenyl-diphosphatase